MFVSIQCHIFNVWNHVAMLEDVDESPEHVLQTSLQGIHELEQLYI